MGRKLRGSAPFLHNVASTKGHLHTKCQLDPSSRLATIDMSQKLERGSGPFGEGLGPNRTQSPLGWAYLDTKWHRDASSRLATVEICQKLGRGLRPLFGKGLGPHLTQSRLGWAQNCEFGANPFNGSRDIWDTNKKKSQTALKPEPYLRAVIIIVVRLDGCTAHLQTRKPRIIIIVNGERNQKTAMHHDDTLLPGASGTSTRHRSIRTTRSLVQWQPASRIALHVIRGSKLQDSSLTSVYYTVFHKIRTPLYFGNNFFKCWSIWMKITSVYSLGNLLSGDVICNCIFYKYSLYNVI